MIKYKLLYKKGYLLKVTTWENDGDDYKTQEIDGLDENELKFYIELAERFKSEYQKNKKTKNIGTCNLGNNEQPLYILFATIHELLKKYNFFPIDINRLDEVKHERIFKDPKVKLYALLEQIDKLKPNVAPENVLELLDSIALPIHSFICTILGTPVGYEYGFCRVYASHEVFKIEEDMILRVADMRANPED